MDIDFPPGVANETSKRRNKINWREVNLVRWDGSTMLPVGGWNRLNYSAFASNIRAAFRWTDNNNIQYTAYLCEEHCYVDDGSGTLIDITPEDGIAPPSDLSVGGWGDGAYSDSTYGTPRDGMVSRLSVAPPAYTLDNWGQELRVMTTADGRLLRWDPSSPSDPLVAVTGAPVGNHSFVVTPDRFIILFGSGGDPSRFDWCDQEDDTDWTPSTTSKAGGFNVEPAATIVSHCLSPTGVLMFTSRLAYTIQSVGLPYVFGYDKLPSECPPPYSPAAIASTPEGDIWFAINGFWLFNGVNAAPILCPIWDWINNSINKSVSRYTASMVDIVAKFELWLFFAAGDDATQNNRVVIHNYRDQTWSMGTLARTCGVASPNDPNPILASVDTVYRHEDGYNYDGADLPWAETHTFNAPGGALTTVKQMLPDVEGASAIQFKFVKRANPASDVETTSAAKLVRSNGYVDVRETARDMRMRVETIVGATWSLGPIEVDMTARGRK